MDPDEFIAHHLAVHRRHRRQQSLVILLAWAALCVGALAVLVLYWSRL